MIYTYRKMNTKLISQQALDIINQYKNFQIGNAICSVPYFNNKTTKQRASLGVFIGKGSPRDIYDETRAILVKEKISETSLNSEELKKILVDKGLGIDCSSFVYYVLDVPDKHLHFPFAKGILGKLRAKLRPVENTNVATLADNRNSKIIPITEIQPGDIITMINNEERDHILLINQIEYQNFKPITIHYVHAVAWPTDGEYGHGIHEGKIEILDLDKKITEQKWIENDKIGDENYTFTRASKSQTELRRLAFL